MMGHLNSFSASGGGNLNKNFPKIQMPGGGCLSFDLTDTLSSLMTCEDLGRILWRETFCLVFLSSHQSQTDDTSRHHRI